MTLFEGITARLIETPKLAVNVLERTEDDPSTSPTRTVVFLHDSVASSLIWQEIMVELPTDLRAIAIDLRGFGGTEHAPVDATRGVRDFSDDVHAALTALGIPTAHLVGWSLGGAVAMQYALDHPVLSLTLQAPVSPYGFGGTHRDGSRVTDDDAGVGAGSANPELVQHLTDRDAGDGSPTAPRAIFRASYVAPGYTSPFEDVWVESMLTTSTAEGNYPGDARVSSNWPGFAAGSIGVLNTLAPKHFDTSGIVALSPKPPILWIHGTVDAIISDSSFSDVNYLGRIGVIPDWPGEETAPAQEMVGQTRDVLEEFAARGGRLTEVVLEGVGHAPHLERPVAFLESLTAHIAAANLPIDPAPPTEAIVLRAYD